MIELKKVLDAGGEGLMLREVCFVLFFLENFLKIFSLKKKKKSQNPNIKMGETKLCSK
jgi:hypothetical protein